MERLRQFITPLALDGDDAFAEMAGQAWEGWPFGRDLYVSELFSLIQQVPGVKHVLDVQLSCRPVEPGKESRRPPAPDQAAGDESRATESGRTDQSTNLPVSQPTNPLTSQPTGSAVQEPELAAVAGRRLEVPDDTLLCSLDHDVEVVDL